MSKGEVKAKRQITQISIHQDPSLLTTAHEEVMEDSSVRVSNQVPASQIANWRETEIQTLPDNNLVVIFTGLMLLVFLAAMDQTIVAAALPSIVRELGGGDAYSWAGPAYLLADA
ncbi:hypothetical protein MPER_04723, partial [Moniliophthora perniciosa FA553]